MLLTPAESSASLGKIAAYPYVFPKCPPNSVGIELELNKLGKEWKYVFHLLCHHKIK